MNPPANDHAAWRKAQRQSLLHQRASVDSETLEAWRLAIDAHLSRGFPGLFHPSGSAATNPASVTANTATANAATASVANTMPVVAFCWPHRNEYDARPLAEKLRASGTVTALPVVTARGAPLIFREWHPGIALADGPGGIPYPTSQGRDVTPAVLLLPMVGFDEAGYRLGYGGGYFDRTLAALRLEAEKNGTPYPHIIGVAYEIARMHTIRPEPHDIPMDYIVTERGIYRREADAGKVVFLGAPPRGQPSGLSSPVCYADEIDPGYFGGKKE